MGSFKWRFANHSMLQLAVGYVYTSNARLDVISFFLVFKNIDITVRLDLRP